MLDTQKVMNVLRGPRSDDGLRVPIGLASGTAGDRTITSSPTKKFTPILTRINARVHFHFSRLTSGPRLSVILLPGLALSFEGPFNPHIDARVGSPPQL